MIVAILAILSASAAAGLRLALPLLIVSLFKTRAFWADVPIASQLHPMVLTAILTIWSLLELFGTKQILGQRALQIVELLLSPIGGAILAISVAKLQSFAADLWLVGCVGGVFAFVLQLVQVGWFFRLQGLPIWASILTDVLCVLLVMYAFEAPREGGLIALLLFWLAVRSASEWRQWSSQAPPQRSDGELNE